MLARSRWHSDGKASPASVEPETGESKCRCNCKLRKRREATDSYPEDCDRVKGKDFKDLRNVTWHLPFEHSSMNAKDMHGDETRKNLGADPLQKL